MTHQLRTPKNQPEAKRVEFIRQAHGEKWVDNYAWLQPENWKEVLKDPTKLPGPIAEYLKAENDYFDEATAHLAPLHDELAAEIRGRIPEKIESLAQPYGTYKYRMRTEADQEHSVLVRTDLDGDFEEVVLDINLEAKRSDESDYFDVSIICLSPDHKTLLWSSDTSGTEFYTLRIRDLESGIDKGYVIENVESASWLNNNTFLYTRVNSDYRSLQVYRHVVGEKTENDVLVFTEKDERFGCNLEKSDSKEYIFIHTGSFDTDEYWYVPCDKPNAKPTLIQSRIEGTEYYVHHAPGDRFVIHTNADDAIDWKIVETPVNKPSIENWVDLVAHKAGQVIRDISVFPDWVVWLQTENALPQIAYMDNAGKVERVTFDEEAFSLGIDSPIEQRPNSFVFSYSSPTTPSKTFKFNLKTAERVLLKEQMIPSGHNPEHYITRRFNVKSYDGAQVPVTLLYKHDTPLDGTAPALLYGYGTYGSSSTAGFSSSRLSLADRGFVCAIAHVRGGSEKGCEWHEQAKQEHKVNSFHDFIAVADALIDKRYCHPRKIVSQGASAGGLLVTASMNMRPELFAGVIAEVPDVDVLNLMLDDTLPGVINHYVEWGNPSASKTVFDAIKNYSPFENSKAIAYPALYVTAGVSDSRVFHWQPARWVANIRSMNTGDNVVLFRTEMQSGHFGKTGRSAEIESIARKYAFAICASNR